MNTATLHVLCCLLTIIASRSVALEIIPPYPKNEIAIEGDSLSISCTARDTSGYPSKVIFTRRGPDQYTYHEIKNTQRVYVTNTTSNDTQGRLTRTAVLHIKPVIYSDHYKSAPYQCWAYPAIPGQGSIEKHVFTLYVISKNELPRATVTGANTVFGAPAKLTCDVTYPGNQITAPLQSLAWTRNNITIINGSTSIDPLIFDSVSAKDGGVYTCVAVVKLQGSKTVNVSLGEAILKIRVQFFYPTEVVGSEGGRVEMECAAEGYPLDITWLRRVGNGTLVPLRDATNITIAERHVVTRPCSYCRYKLTISNLQSHDAGRYVCKANEGGQHHFDLLISDKVVTTDNVIDKIGTTRRTVNDDTTRSTADTVEPTAGCLGAMVSFRTVLVGVLVGLLL